MDRYKRALRTMGSCKLFVSPLSSKLLSIGVLLACYDHRYGVGASDDFDVGIPYVETASTAIPIRTAATTNCTRCGFAVPGKRRCRTPGAETVRHRTSPRWSNEAQLHPTSRDIGVPTRQPTRRASLSSDRRLPVFASPSPVGLELSG